MAAKTFGVSVEFRQSNHEGALVDWIHEAGEKADGVIINAGAYTHTSIALHDAIRSIAPVPERKSLAIPSEDWHTPGKHAPNATTLKITKGNRQMLTRLEAPAAA